MVTVVRKMVTVVLVYNVHDAWESSLIGIGENLKTAKRIAHDSASRYLREHDEPGPAVFTWDGVWKNRGRVHGWYGQRYDSYRLVRVPVQKG